MDGSEDPDTEEQKRKPSGQELDYLNPYFDMHDLFASFNERFFWGILGAVELKWNYTMTSRAGLCVYQEPGGLCTIKLSAPLLCPRPRSDLVEALLHEMIHAYLFVTQNFEDTEDHGPEFQKHIRRIYKEGGIAINIYCKYLSETSYDRRHIWRCTGPCRNQQPYMGYLMKTVNRAPGPSDRWWNTHMRECGGNFKKISPIKRNGKGKKRKGQGKRKKTVARAKGVRNLSRSFGPENPSKSNPSDEPSTSTAVDESDKGESSKTMEQTEEKPDNSNEMEEKPDNSNEMEEKPDNTNEMEEKPDNSNEMEEKPDNSNEMEEKPDNSNEMEEKPDNTNEMEEKPDNTNEMEEKPDNTNEMEEKPDNTNEMEEKPDNSNEMEEKPGTSQSGDDFQSMPGTSRSSDDFQSMPGTSRSSDDFQSMPGTSRSSDDFESAPSTSQAGDENLQPKTRETKKKGLKGKKRKISDVAEPDASAVDEKRPSISCPVCAHGFDPELINDHVNACMEEQEFMNEISPDENDDYSHGQGHYEQCPLLGDYLDEEEAAERVEASLHFFVYNEDIAGDDEPGADKVRCPCCWKWVKEGKINEHIDACLTYNTLQNNPPDSP